MYLRLLFFLFLLSFSNAAKVVPLTNIQVDTVKNEGDRANVPLVRYGAQLDGLLSASDSNMLGIIGGDPTDILSHPYQVAIDNGHSFVCSGALLNRIWAIALASCTKGAEPKDLTVRVGSDSNVHGGTVLNVTGIVVHPNFNFEIFDYDFALLKLNTYICFNEYSTDIRFCESKPTFRVWGTVSGWGVHTNKQTESGTFRQLQMHITTRSACQTYYDVTKDTITDRMICASNHKKGPCCKDFGDPLVVNNTLYGLYSWSRDCANPNYPAVFTNLASVKEWIYQVMNSACTCGIY